MALSYRGNLALAFCAAALIAAYQPGFSASDDFNEVLAGSNIPVQTQQCDVHCQNHLHVIGKLAYFIADHDRKKSFKDSAGHSEEFEDPVMDHIHYIVDPPKDNIEVVQSI